jgi:endonuclease/exonuclease/phosphatase family metal-dependent hydrolase
MTWNIERGQQLDVVATVLKQEAPTVALLQEVDLNASRTGRKHVAEELARRLAVNYRFAAEFEELGQGSSRDPAYHGQAILTALRVSSERFIRFRDQSGYWRPRWFLPNWAMLQRRVGGRLALVIEVGAAPHPFVLYNVHLESRESESLRLRQIDEVIADAQRYPATTPVILAGDLNTRGASPPAIASLLRAGFRQAAGNEVTTTHGTAIDWIFVRGAVHFSEGFVHRDIRASDHYPLTVQIKLEPPACP